MNKPELISPAGTLEKLKIAFEFGADAVYAGVPDFSLRTRINDFNYNKIKQGVKYAHKRGKKVYATLNIYAHNKHLKKVGEMAKKYNDAEVDAIIISDPGILAVVKKVAPEMNIYLSTQANCTNWQAAKFWQEQGVKRIVLAREITLSEIAEIHSKLPTLELEYFVHGAMCMAYSGRCILSKWLSGRSANLGECSQPCRWEYNIESSPCRHLNNAGSGNKAMFCSDNKKINAAVNEKNGVEMDIEQDGHGVYILNSKDLCLIEHIDKLWKAGISSFKIEGRTKSAYYVGAITKLYRAGIDKIFYARKDDEYLSPAQAVRGQINRVSALDGMKMINRVSAAAGKLKSYIPPKGWKSELEKITNRGYTTGFLFGEKNCEHNFARSHEECEWQFVGEVMAPACADKMAGEGDVFQSVCDKKKHITGAQELPIEKFSLSAQAGLTRIWQKRGRLVIIKIHNALRAGDDVEFVVPRGKNIKMKIKKMYDVKNGKELKEAHGGQEQIIFLKSDKNIPIRSIVRKASNFSVTSVC